MGNASGKRCEQDTALRSEQQTSWINEVCGESRGELADDNSQRVTQHSVSESVQEEYSTTGDCGSDRWPARPSEPQHDWEEPRVTELGDTESQQGSSNNHRGESGSPGEPQEVQPRGGDRGSLRSSHGQAQSGLGRATHGASSRVDRLRLLGNGVVPATAAKAFLTLINRIQ